MSLRIKEFDYILINLAQLCQGSMQNTDAEAPSPRGARFATRLRGPEAHQQLLQQERAKGDEENVAEIHDFAVPRRLRLLLLRFLRLLLRFLLQQLLERRRTRRGALQILRRVGGRGDVSMAYVFLSF